MVSVPKWQERSPVGLAHLGSTGEGGGGVTSQGAVP